MLNSPGVNRIDVAKQSMVQLVEGTPPDVSFGLISFSTCGRPQDHGRYGPSSRPQLIQRIRRIQLDSDTALADALAYAPQYVTGGRSEEEPVNIVLFSDGQDSCGGDPCAQARRLKQQLPHAYVNVIGIGRELQVQRCIADATGGLFLEARDTEQLADALERASGQDLPEHCR